MTNQTNQTNLTNATSLTDVNNIMEVYVDASFDTNAVGAAYFIQTKDGRILKQQKFKMSTNWSSFQATIFALNEALNHLVTIKESTRSMTTSSAPPLTCFNIAINLHNKSMISALSDHNSTNDLIFRIYEKNYELLNKNTKLYLIQKQFSDSNGFEKVKQLANKALESHIRFETDLINKSRLKKIIKDKNLKEWDEIWQMTETGLKTKRYFPTIEDRIKADKYFKTNFYLTQIITNHGNFAAYLKRFHFNDNELCEECGVEDTADHRIYDCIKFQEQRDQLMNKCDTNGSQWPIIERQLISFENIDYFKEYVLKIFN